jgi:hypothetical protein
MVYYNSCVFFSCTKSFVLRLPWVCTNVENPTPRHGYALCRKFSDLMFDYSRGCEPSEQLFFCHKIQKKFLSVVEKVLI